MSSETANYEARPRVPVVLDSGTITLGTAKGIQGPADTSRLTLDTPWWLDEIVVDLPIPQLSALPSMGLDVWMQLRIGQLPITKDYVPVALFTERPNSNEAPVYRWRLPKPIYMPPLVYLQPRLFFEDGTYGNSSAISASAGITYVGRRADNDPIPASIWLPYVAAFVGASALTQNEQSTEYDLVNPFDLSLSLDYLTADVINAAGGFSPSPEQIYRNVFFRMVDSSTRIVVRDRTRLGAVFPATTKAWRTRGIQIPPFGYYLAYLEEDFSSEGESPVATRVLMGMVGRRPVEVALIKKTAK